MVQIQIPVQSNTSIVNEAIRTILIYYKKNFCITKNTKYVKTPSRNKNKRIINKEKNNFWGRKTS